MAARQEAIYERASKTVRCAECPTEPEVAEEALGELEVEPESDSQESGAAGASAQREYEQRKTRREEQIRNKHPRLGGLILALSDDPQSTKAWASDAKGEAALGARLDKHTWDSIAVLHDRRIPGTKANIDHIVVTAGGVFVVDAKRYVNKRPDLRVEGGILRPRVEKLIVGGSDRTKLVDGVLGQVERVRAALVDDTIDVSGVLCFIDADWPLVGGSILRPRRTGCLAQEAEQAPRRCERRGRRRRRPQPDCCGPPAGVTDVVSRSLLSCPNHQGSGQTRSAGLFRCSRLFPKWERGPRKGL